MIIWLASYPRSGNTLLRTICRRCFGLYSYADEPVDYVSEFRSNPDLIGHREYAGKWAQFYRQASRSADTYLVKTHRPPVDDQPYIYIVRDGRSSIRSYQKFNKNYNKLDLSLVDLILGDGNYGSWSEHYSRWNDRSDIKHLIFRFEDIVDISEHTLKQVAELIDFKQTPVPWVNPVDHLKKVEPGFFGDRNKQFIGDKKWTPAHEYLFEKIHGKLMLQLGYYKDLKKSGSDFLPHADFLLTQILTYISDLKKKNRFLEKACEERLELINQLSDTCEERLRLINSLHEHLDQA